MAVDTEDRIDLRGDGRVILYKRAGLKDPVWQARITKASRSKEPAKKAGAYPFE